MSFNMMNYNMMGPWLGFGGWMVLAMIAFWVIIGVGVYLLISYFYRPNRGGEQDRALAIARERYARGEITSDEYEKIRRNLQ